ncbi:unnamed protein product, partial [Bubo scandiacus]
MGRGELRASLRFVPAAPEGRFRPGLGWDRRLGSARPAAPRPAALRSAPRAPLPPPARPRP